jgi:GNAT superfamily N-acetyltransferase
MKRGTNGIRHLRLATREDIPALIRLRIAFLKVDKPEPNALKEDLLVSALGNYFVRHLEAGDLVCWVATDLEKIVAGGAICFNHYPPDFEAMEDEMAQLVNLYALPGYRDEEVEQQLFAKLLEEAERRDVSVITVQDAEMGKGGNTNFVLARKVRN